MRARCDPRGAFNAESVSCTTVPAAGFARGFFWEPDPTFAFALAFAFAFALALVLAIAYSPAFVGVTTIK
jgi:hypothetical protein